MRQGQIEDIEAENSLALLTQCTYLEYQEVLRLYTLNNLPQEMRDELLLDSEKIPQELGAAWYEELKKTEQYLQGLFQAGKLEKREISIDSAGGPKTVEIITGASLYACEEDIGFVWEYKEQVDMLVPLANLFLFMDKHVNPIEIHKTLCEFKDLAQRPSNMFGIDMTERYAEFIDSHRKEVEGFNQSMRKLKEVATNYLYSKPFIFHIPELTETSFVFDLDTDRSPHPTAKQYARRFKKLEDGIFAIHRGDSN